MPSPTNSVERLDNKGLDRGLSGTVGVSSYSIQDGDINDMPRARTQSLIQMRVATTPNSNSPSSPSSPSSPRNSPRVSSIKSISSTQSCFNDPHWIWYAIGFLSAVIMGTSAFVISFNFMLGQVPLLIVIACAGAGMFLNTLLYWKDSARKLSTFFRYIRRKPANLLRKESLISLASALCVGFLALKSYIDQFSLLSSASLKLIPYWPLSVLFSIANAVSTFVLFYEPPSTIFREESNSLPRNPRIFFLYLSWRNIKTQLQKPFHRNLSDLIAIAQSSMYSLTNLHCMQQVLTLLIPSAPVLILVISTTLALALFCAECAFNCDKMSKINCIDSALYWDKFPRLQMLLYTLVILNGFANGWIALGDLRHLSKALQTVIVGIGSLVSFSVMRDAVGDINKLFFDHRQNLHRFFPKNPKDLKNAVSAIGKLFIFATGFYFIRFPVAFEYIFSHYPFAASAMFSSFVYAAVSTAKEAYEYYQPVFVRFSVPYPKETGASDPPKNVSSRSFNLFGLFGRDNQESQTAGRESSPSFTGRP